MSDPGIQCLEIIHSTARIDESWTERRSRGFSWIGNRLEQRIDASPMFESGGIEFSQVTCEVIVATGTTRDTQSIQEALCKLNRHAICSAYVYDDAAHAIKSVIIGYVQNEILGWRARELATFALIQLGQAESEAEWIADVAGGHAVIASHPTSGAREKADEMLSAIDGVVEEQGRGPSRFADVEEFEALAETARRMNAATLGGTAGGIAFEFPHGTYTALLQLSTTERHRRIGAGLSVRLCLPTSLDRPFALEAVAMLNQREAQGESRSGLSGAWCLAPPPGGGRDVLSYKAFLPNIIHGRGCAQDVLGASALRARWVNGVFNPGAAEVDTWQLLRKRYELPRSLAIRSTRES